MLFLSKILKIKNNKGFILSTDVLVGIVLLNFISIIFFSAVSYFYTNLNIIRDNFYNEILLTECAEVVHGFRYGEWDRNNESGWDNLRTAYPTGMYYLKFDEINNTWGAFPIMTTGSGGYHVQDIKTVVQNNLDRVGGPVEVIPIGDNSEKNIAFRMFYIDTNSSNQITVKCYVKYNFNKKTEKVFDGSDYKELKFIMMNYL